MRQSDVDIINELVPDKTAKVAQIDPSALQSIQRDMEYLNTTWAELTQKLKAVSDSVSQKVQSGDINDDQADSLDAYLGVELIQIFSEVEKYLGRAEDSLR